MIDLHLHFDKKNPPNSFEIMFWHENTFEIMFWIWPKNSIEIIIWHENSFEIELISCFHKKGLKKQSGQRLPTTFYIFSNQILEICILTGKIQQIHLRLCFDVKNCLKLCFYLAHIIEQPIFWIPNLEYLQWNFCFDFFNDSENTFWGFFEI